MKDSFKHQAKLRSLTEYCHLFTNMRAILDNRGYRNFFMNARTDTYFS
ncbi:hypothetical protein [Lysinibacillus sphaericus]